MGRTAVYGKHPCRAAGLQGLQAAFVFQVIAQRLRHAHITAARRFYRVKLQLQILQHRALRLINGLGHILGDGLAGFFPQGKAGAGGVVNAAVSRGGCAHSPQPRPGR